MMRMRITRHGAVYTAMGVLLLISGLLRGELLSAVCGGLLTLYTGFAVAATAVTALCWKAEEPAFASDGGGFTITPARSKKAQAEPAQSFPPCVPGTAAFYTIEFSREVSRSPESTAEAAVTLYIPLQRKRTEYYPHNLTRGRYFYKRQYLTIRDFAGFLTVSYMLPPRLSAPYAVVQPALPPERAVFPNLRSRAVNDLPSQERTHELYESRPYFPGDDPRKIHWKLYAHTNTLSIKLGAFEPPPVKRLTIYIEEPVCAKKKERALTSSVFDAFIGRLSGVIIELLNEGIQCALLLYDYHLYDYHADDSQQSLQRYEITEEGSAAAAQIQKLLTIPALRASPKAIPPAAEIFKAVPDGEGLLYCYMPTGYMPSRDVSRDTAGALLRSLRKEGITVGGEHIAAYQNTAAYRKITAYSRSGVETFFCLVAPPVAEDCMQPDELLHRVLSRGYLHRLLYASAASARQDAFYRKVQEAAEQELRIFTAGNCHAELL